MTVQNLDTMFCEAGRRARMFAKATTDDGFVASRNATLSRGDRQPYRSPAAHL